MAGGSGGHSLFSPLRVTPTTQSSGFILHRPDFVFRLFGVSQVRNRHHRLLYCLLTASKGVYLDSIQLCSVSVAVKQSLIVDEGVQSEIAG